MATIATDLPAKLLGADRDTIRDQIRAALRSDATISAVYNNFEANGQGKLFLEIMVNAVMHAAYFSNRAAKNAYLPIADLRSAVSYLCEALGYKMRGAAAGTVDLTTVTLTSGPYAFDVPLPYGTAFIADGVTFEAIEAKVIPAGNVTLAGTWSLRQGETRRRTFAADGTQNQRILFTDVSDESGEFVAHGSVRVWVQGVEWTVADFIRYGDVNTCQFNYNSKFPELRFGDNNAGTLPIATTTILAQYVVTSGKAGFVDKLRFSAPKTPVVIAGQAIPLTVSNAAAVGGMDDRETLEEASRNAPAWRAFGDVAVTTEAIETMARGFTDAQYGSVAIAKANSARSASSDHALGALLARLKFDVGVPIAEVEDQIVLLEAHIASAVAAVESLRSLVALAQASGVTVANLSGQLTNTRTVIQTQVESFIAALSALQSHSSAITVGVASLNIWGSRIAAAIAAIPSDPVGPDLLTDVTKNALVAMAAWITTASASVSAGSGAIATDYASLSNVKTAIETEVGNIQAVKLGLDQAAADIASNSVLELAQVVVLRSAAGDTGALVDASNDATALRAANVGFEDEALAVAQGIYEHVDDLLSHDCKANLISVPILTYDSEGFFMAPSNGLVNRLTTYLNGQKKSPTVTFSVASGADFLVEADVLITGDVLPGYVKSSVEASASSVALSVLKGRSFGQSLYLREFYDAIRNAEIPGVGTSLTVQFVGPARWLDSAGNLVIDGVHIITKKGSGPVVSFRETL